MIWILIMQFEEILEMNMIIQRKCYSTFIGITFECNEIFSWCKFHILTWPHSFPLLKKPELFLRIISLTHAPMNVTDVSIGSINCDLNNADLFELHKLCATFSASVCINYCLPIKVYYRICTLRHIRIEINHGSHNVFWVLTWIGRY